MLWRLCWSASEESTGLHGGSVWMGGGGAIALNSDKKHLRDVKKYSRDMKKYSIRQMLHISLLGRGLESEIRISMSQSPAFQSEICAQVCLRTRHSCRLSSSEARPPLHQMANAWLNTFSYLLNTFFHLLSPTQGHVHSERQMPLMRTSRTFDKLHQVNSDSINQSLMAGVELRACPSMVCHYLSWM